MRHHLNITLIINIEFLNPTDNFKLGIREYATILEIKEFIEKNKGYSNISIHNTIDILEDNHIIKDECTLLIIILDEIDYSNLIIKDPETLELLNMDRNFSILNNNIIRHRIRHRISKYDTCNRIFPFIIKEKYNIFGFVYKIQFSHKLYKDYMVILSYDLYIKNYCNIYISGTEFNLHYINNIVKYNPKKFWTFIIDRNEFTDNIECTFISHRYSAQLKFINKNRIYMNHKSRKNYNQHVKYTSLVRKYNNKSSRYNNQPRRHH